MTTERNVGCCVLDLSFFRSLKGYPDLCCGSSISCAFVMRNWNRVLDFDLWTPSMIHDTVDCDCDCGCDSHLVEMKVSLWILRVNEISDDYVSVSKILLNLFGLG